MASSSCVRTLRRGATGYRLNNSQAPERSDAEVLIVRQTAGRMVERMPSHAGLDYPDAECHFGPRRTAEAIDDHKPFLLGPSGHRSAWASVPRFYSR
jgi:hypothetical protein